jgi:tetratricopeptide (TPR) repeat protein
MTLGDVATGRARQDLAAATALSSEVDPLTGSLIYCSILWSCRTFAEWSRAAQWSPGFELWCNMAYAEVTGACRLHNADVLASVGRLAEALREIDRAIPLLIEEGIWELGDAYRVRGDIRAMMGETEAARSDYQMCISLGWDVEPGLARLKAEAGDVPSALASLNCSLSGRSWYARQRRGWLLANKAQIAADAGFVEEATSALEELSNWSDATSIAAIQAMTFEARAELEVQEGHLAGAIPICQFACQLWKGIRHEFNAARLQLRLADLMEQTGDSTGAHMERAAARMAAERIGARRLLARLDTLEGPQGIEQARSGSSRQDPDSPIRFTKALRAVPGQVGS